MNLPETIAIGVAALGTHQAADDDVIVKHLCASGVEEELATRLVQFIPIAFCRFIMKPSGIRFAPNYVIMDTRGRIVAEHLLEEEPVFREALVFCEAALEQGHSASFFLPIAARSAGYQAIQQLLQQDSQPEKIITTPPIIPAASQQKKKWWRFRE